MLTTSRPRIAVVTSSNRVPGLVDLMLDADRRGLYRIACIVTTEAEFVERAAVEGRRIAVLHHPMPCRRMSVRAEHDARTVALLEPFAPDLVVLAGYLYIATDWLLGAYQQRVINLHLSDLTLRLPDGRPRFAGLRAVRDAIVAGETATYATSHVVTEELDGGPPLVRSWPFAVAPLVRDARLSGATDMLKAYAYAHEQWMLRQASGPVLVRTLASIAAGEIDLDTLARHVPAGPSTRIVDVGYSCGA
ncbi:MAG: formyltransferase family protein [Acidobacteriota bacterium]